MYQYQQVILDKLSGGFKPGEMLIFSSGRQSGKSQLNHYLRQYMQWLPESDTHRYKVCDQAMVDDKLWYTINCSKDVADWVRQQTGEGKDWYQHIANRFDDFFDIPEELYLMLVLRFGNK